jgi:flagellar biosynthetic protein FliS
MIPKAEHSYQAATIHSADCVQLVIMLHDMLVEDLRRCIAATRSGEVQTRTNYAAHAFEVLGQLQLGLDHAEGNEPARNMDRLYSIARMELLRAQASKDASVFQKQMDIFSSLRDAWKKAQAQRGDSKAAAEQIAPGQEDERPGGGWTV